MAKLIVVPDWLNAELISNGQSLDTLAGDIESALSSKIDVINLHKAQWQFLKLLCNNKYSLETMYSMYQHMFVHQLPDYIELEVFIKQDLLTDINCDDMATGSGTLDRLRFRIEQDISGTMFYIIGECVDQGCSIESVCAEPYAIVCSILKEKHRGVRIHGRGTDKSSVFRESPVLTNLYVDLTSHSVEA